MPLRLYEPKDQSLSMTLSQVHEILEENTVCKEPKSILAMHASAHEIRRAIGLACGLVGWPAHRNQHSSMLYTSPCGTG